MSIPGNGLPPAPGTRDHALARVGAPRAVVAHVDYHSSGQLLITGAAANVAPALARLAAHAALHCTCLITDAGTLPRDLESDSGAQLMYGIPRRLSGHLGDFRLVTDDVLLAQALTLVLPPDKPGFDLVLDLNAVSLIGAEVPPPGYAFAAPGDSRALDAALALLPTLVGEFEKPRYFQFDASRCAHGRSGQRGCSRCIDACPAEAIVSVGDVIEVNPMLCQGAGSCASACPSGAIRYAYPPAADSLDYWRRLLGACREAGGGAPVLLVHDARQGREALYALGDRLDDRLLPVEVEEIGSVGLEAWLAALAWGADAVCVLMPADTPQRVQREIRFQLAIAHELLDDLGYARDRLRLIGPGEAAAPAPADRGLPPPALFAALDDKRTLIAFAVDHLRGAPPPGQRLAVLPDGAPFGEVVIDATRCTLCMACVSQCPANALAAGDVTPQLRFVEARCVQCGLCVRSCPEQAVSLSPRYLYDTQARSSLRLLHEDEPFCCIRCRKPFATRSVIESIGRKMHDHPLFAGAARARLHMCEDCRVKDLYEATPAAPSPHPGEGQ